MKLRRKTSLLFALLVALAILASGAALLLDQRRSISKSVVKSAEGLAAAQAHAVAAFVKTMQFDAERLAAMLPPEAVQRGDTAALSRILQDVARHYPQFANGLFVLDAEGRFVVDQPAHKELQGSSFAFREYFQRTRASARGVVSEPYRSKRTQRPVVTFTGAVRDAQGRFVGMVGCSVDLLSPEALGSLTTLRLGDSGYAYVIDRSRLMIVHPEDERILQRDVVPGSNHLLERALTGVEVSGDTVNSRGVPMLLALKLIEGTDWVLGVQQTQAEAFAPVRRATERMVLILMLGAVGAAVAGAMVVRRVTTPVTLLDRTTREISADLRVHGHARNVGTAARGRLQQLGGDDEIAGLAGSFDNLVDQLEQAIAAAERAGRDWSRTFDAVADAVFIVDGQGRVQRLNRRAATWFGLQAEQALGRDCAALVFGGGQVPPEFPRFGDGGVEPSRCVLSLPDRGREYELDVTPIVTPLSGPDDAVGSVLILRDVTEARQAQALIRHLAFHDPLTDLPTRALLRDRLGMMLANARRNGGRFCLMFFDLDRFKQVNDTHGHGTGDALLKAVAQRLQACVREQDTLARMGGDEFVLAAADAGAEAAMVLAEKLLDELARPFELAGLSLEIGASIGIALYPGDGEDVDALLRSADQAMYEAKRQGRGTWRVATGEAQPA